MPSGLPVGEPIFIELLTLILPSAYFPYSALMQYPPLEKVHIGAGEAAT